MTRRGSQTLLALLFGAAFFLLANPASAVVGDQDMDGDIDIDDVDAILAPFIAANFVPVPAPGDPRDLDMDNLITARDARIAAACCTLPLCARGTNAPPVLDPIGDRTADELQNLMFTATATDPNVLNTLTFSLDAASLAAGMTIDGMTGAFSWTPTEAQGPGVFPVTVTVTDDGVPVQSDSETFNITVNEVNLPPVLGAIGDQIVDELVNLAFMATATDADAPANTLTFSLDAASLAAGMTINAATGAFSWMPTEAQGPGVFPVTLTVTDNGVPAMNDAETFNITVNEVNVAPVLGVIGDQTVDELVNLAFMATAGDADAPANALVFSLDAASLAAGMTINAATGAFSWTPTEAQGPGVFPVTLTVTDNGVPAMNDAETFNITVNEVNLPPVLGAIGNQTVDELVNLAFMATATDADAPANTLTFSLDAASLAAGMTINAATGAFSWTPTEAQGPGVFPVTLTVTDNGVPVMNDAETFNVTVNEVNVAPVLGAIGNQVVDELVNLAFMATATDADVPANTLTFSLDAASLAAGMTINGATGAFSWTPTEAQGPGVFPVTLTVTDNGVPAMNDAETFNITVNEVNVPPAVTGESFDTIVNTLFEHSAGPNTLSAAAQVHAVGNLLANDSDPDLPAQALTAALNTQATPGAAITVNADGTFTYVSAPGDTTAGDSFTYTVSDGNGGMTGGTVTINFAERVWYVQDNAPAGGLGRSSDPFDTLAEAEAASLVNDFIFVFRGNTGVTPINEGIALKSGQKLHGEGIGLSLNVGLNGNPAPTNLVAPNPGNEPEIDFTGGSAVTVAANGAVVDAVEIRGLNLRSSTGTGDKSIDITSTGGPTTLGVTIRDNIIGGAPNEGVRVAAGHTSGTATVRVENNTIAATGNAFDARLTAAGRLDVAFDNNTGLTSAAAAGAAVHIEDVAGTGSLFVTGFANNAVLGTSNGAGVRIFGAIFDSDPSDADFDLVTGGNLTVGAVVDRIRGGVFLGTPANRVVGNLGFGTVSIFTFAGAALSASGAGIAVGGPPPTAGFLLAVTTGTADAIGGPAVSLDPLTSNVQLTNISSSASPGPGVLLSGLSGSFVASAGAIAGSLGPGFQVIGGTVASTYSGGITQSTNAPAVSVSGGHNSGMVTFQTGTISATAGTGLQFDNADGTYNLNGTTTLNGGDAGIDILNGSAGTFNFSSNTSITSPSGTAFNVASSAANVDYPGSITQNNAAMGVNLSGNTGTVTFRGGMVLNTGAMTALSATGGGTVNVCATADCAGGAPVVNTIGATTALTGMAVNISGTTIGANHVTLRSVDVNGAATAINLNATGATGGFRVTGIDGPCGRPGALDCDGGTIESTTADAIALNDTDGFSLANVHLRNIGNMAGPTNTLSTHDAIDATDVIGLTLTNVSVNSISDSALRGLRVSNLTVQSSDLRDANRYHLANIADQGVEAMLRLTDLGGTNVVDDTNFEDAAGHIEVDNSTVDLTLLRVQRSRLAATWKNLSGNGVGRIGIDVVMRSNSDATLHIGDPNEANAALGNTFEDGAVAAIRVTHFDGSSAGTINAIISRNTFRTTTLELACIADNAQGGVLLRSDGTNAARFNAIVSRNSFTQIQNAEGRIGNLSMLFNATAPGNGGVVQVRADNNTFTDVQAAAINVADDGTASATVLLDNNIVSTTSLFFPCAGVSFTTPCQPVRIEDQGGGALHLVMQNMDLNGFDTTCVETGQDFKAFRNFGGGSLCLALSGNDAAFGYLLDQNTGTFQLEQGASAVTSPVATVISNNSNLGAVTVDGGSTINVVGPMNTQVCNRPTGGIF